jgi:hypothetical protein
MAETLFDEGLDTILGVFPKNGTNFANLYVGLFTSQSASTVGARTLTLTGDVGTTGSGETIIEASGGGYSRKAIPAASWGAASTNGSGRRITATQVSFDESNAAFDVTQINGYFITTQSSGYGSGVLIGQANFDDGAPAIVNSAGVIVRVTPSLQLNV